MSVSLRLARHGTKKAPFYRIVVTDSRNPRDGRFLEMIGVYDPMREPVRLEVNRERVAHWVARGGKCSATLERVLRTTPAPEAG